MGDFQMGSAHRKEGWYPDPYGDPTVQRWWGPDDWSSQTRPSEAKGTPYQPPNHGLSRDLVAGLAAFAVIAALVIWGVVALATGGDSADNDAGSTTPTTATKATTRAALPDYAENDQVLDVCRDAVRNQLKDPDSAQFRNDKVVTSSGNGNWSVVGQVNARNSFGGRNGYVAYGCDATQTGDTVNARATLVE